MTTNVKIEEVKELRHKFLNAKGGVILADYRGMTVDKITDLRNQLRTVDTEFKVVKNTLVKRAIKDTQFEAITGDLTGPVSIAFNYNKAPAFAKVMTTFAKKDNNKLNIKTGIIDGTKFNEEEIKAIADLPSREVLLGKMLGSMQSPATNLVGVFSCMLRNLVNVLNAVSEKKGGQ